MRWAEIIRIETKWDTVMRCGKKWQARLDEQIKQDKMRTKWDNTRGDKQRREMWINKILKIKDNTLQNETKLNKKKKRLEGIRLNKWY